MPEDVREKIQEAFKQAAELVGADTLVRLADYKPFGLLMLLSCALSSSTGRPWSMPS